MQDEKSQPTSPLGCCNNSLWCCSTMRKSGEKGEIERGPSSTSNTFSQQHLQMIWRRKNDGVGWKIVTAVWRLCSCDLFPHPCPLSWGVFFFWMCCVMQSYSFNGHFLCPNFPTFLIIFFTEKLSHCLWGLFIPPAALNSGWNFLSRFLQFSFHLYGFIAFQHMYHALSMSSPFCFYKLEKL